MKMIGIGWANRGMNFLGALFELPPRGFSDEVLFPQTKRQAWTYRKNRLFHRQNVLLHSLHVELVLALVGREELSARSDLGNLRRAFDDDRFVRVLCAYDAVGIRCQVARLARFASCAEQEAPILPQAPHHHGVRQAVGLDGSDPVGMRSLQVLLGPSPRQ